MSTKMFVKVQGGGSGLRLNWSINCQLFRSLVYSVNSRVIKLLEWSACIFDETFGVMKTRCFSLEDCILQLANKFKWSDCVFDETIGVIKAQCFQLKGLHRNTWNFLQLANKFEWQIKVLHYWQPVYSFKKSTEIWHHNICIHITNHFIMLQEYQDHMIIRNTSFFLPKKKKKIRNTSLTKQTHPPLLTTRLVS